jgi:outer membrane receptor protein involved in Fe transport
MIPDNAVESIDVLLGSSGVAQGSDGLTGTVDFVQAKAGRGVQAPISPWASVRADSADGQTLAAGVDGKLADFAYSFDGSRGWYGDRLGGAQAGDHLYGSAAGERRIPNSGYDQFDVAGRMAYTGFAGNRFEISGGRVKQMTAPRADGYRANSGDAARISRYYDPQVFDYAHARHILHGDGAMPQVQTTLWFHRHQEYMVREDLRSGPVRYRRREYNDQISTVGLDLQLTSLIGDQHQFGYGVTGYEDRTANDAQVYQAPNANPGAAVFQPAASGPGATTVPDGSRYQGFGLYAQDLWTFAPQWDLLVGARWSRYAWRADLTADRVGFSNGELTGSTQALTGEARLAYHPVETATVFTGVSQGFRAPNLTNLYGIQDSASSGIVTKGNADLDSEKSVTGEVGAKYAENRDSAALTFFYTRINDLIQRTYVDVNGDGVINTGDIAISDNANHADLAGFELSHDWSILGNRLPSDSRLALFNVVNATTGEAEQQNAAGKIETVHLSRANRVFGVGGITYEPTPVWYVTSQVRWSGAYKEVNPGDAADVRHTTFGSADGVPGAMPGYAVLDLKAGWRSPRNGLRVDAAAENLSNVSYREVGSGIDGSGLAGVIRVTARY